MSDALRGLAGCGIGCRSDREPWPHTMVWGNCARAVRSYDGSVPVIVEERINRNGGTVLRRRVIVVDDWEVIP